MDEESKLPFTAHLEELRKRLIVCFIAVGIGFVISYGFKEYLFQILVHPLVKVMAPGDSLIFTGLPEAFFTYLKVAFLAGLMLAAPVIIYEFWIFVAPGLYDKEKRLMLPIVFLSTFFFIGGALFGYFLVFPWGFKFFLGFATETIRPMPSMKEYLGFSAKLLLAFGLVFRIAPGDHVSGPTWCRVGRIFKEEPQVCHPYLFCWGGHLDTPGCGHPDYDGSAADASLRNLHYRSPHFREEENGRGYSGRRIRCGWRQRVRPFKRQASRGLNRANRH